MRRKIISVILAFTLFFPTLTLAEQEQATRIYEENGHFYVIDFDYNPMITMVPAPTYGGQAHYDATISVFEVRV